MRRCLSTIKSWTPPTMDCKIKKWNAFWMVSAKVFIFDYKLIRSCELRSVLLNQHKAKRPIHVSTPCKRVTTSRWVPAPVAKFRELRASGAITNFRYRPLPISRSVITSESIARDSGSSHSCREIRTHGQTTTTANLLKASSIISSPLLLSVRCMMR